MDYPKSHCSSSHLPELQFKNLMIFMNKEIIKKYYKHEIKRLSKRKNRKRSTGAGRHFKLDLKDRFVMLFVYYRLYITYTLAGFLFDLDQRATFAEIFKRLNIEYGKTMCTNSTKDIPNNKEAKNSRGSREIFSRLSCFYRLYRTIADTKTCCR